jgi:hypothetical protein
MTDFICPFCYIAPDRNRILRDAGVAVICQPMQIHPEIGLGGTPAPPRSGPMYEQLVAAAREGLLGPRDEEAWAWLVLGTHDPRATPGQRSGVKAPG